MPDNVPVNDPKRIWLDQPTEPPAMTLGKLLLRQKARELHAKTRRVLFNNIAVAFFVIAVCVFGITWANDPVPQAAFALAAAWALAGQYFLNRGMWLAPLPGDAALMTSLEFYRQAIEGRRRLFRNVLCWAFGPAALVGAATVLSIVRAGASSQGPLPTAEAGRLFLNMAPFLTLLAVWIIAFIVMRVRGQRELQREIDELNDIERESGVT
jgi:hypothetical protein